MSSRMNIKTRLAGLGAASLMALGAGVLGSIGASAEESRTAPTETSTCLPGVMQLAGDSWWQYGTHHLVEDDGSLIRVLQEQGSIDLDLYLRQRVMACTIQIEKPPVPGPNLYRVYSIARM